jgi:hypothetical protein
MIPNRQHKEMTMHLDWFQWAFIVFLLVIRYYERWTEK